MWVRGCVWAVAAVAMIGCDEVTSGLAAITAAPNATNDGIRTLSLLNGDARVRGPDGYCVDQGASRARTGFAVLAGCALMSDGAAVMPTLDGLITVQFGAPDTASVSGNEDAFAAFLESDAGRGILAGSGDGAQVASVATLRDRSGVMARFEDTSGPAFAGTTGPQWRGFMDVNGRLVTVTVLSFERATLSRSQGERLLSLAMREVAQSNPAPTASSENG